MVTNNCRNCKWAKKHKYKFIETFCCNPVWNVKDRGVYILSASILTDCPHWEGGNNGL